MALRLSRQQLLDAVRRRTRTPLQPFSPTTAPKATVFGTPINPDILPAGFENFRVTQGFGAPQAVKATGETTHMGIDFAAPGGTPIPSPVNGRVVSVANNRGFGQNVVIHGDDGRFYRFSHLSGFDVGAGQSIKRNEVLGRVGTTGISTGNHLDYRVYQP